MNINLMSLHCALKYGLNCKCCIIYTLPKKGKIEKEKFKGSSFQSISNSHPLCRILFISQMRKQMQTPHWGQSTAQMVADWTAEQRALPLRTSSSPCASVCLDRQQHHRAGAPLLKQEKTQNHLRKQRLYRGSAHTTPGSRASLLCVNTVQRLQL